MNMVYDKQLAAVSKHMVQRCETVAVAESVTAGLIQSAFSMATDATSFFQGGITAYNFGQKARHLRVDPIHAERCNCISPEVACEMATGVLDLFSSHWGIAITGYAAPVPALKVRSCYAFYSFAYKGSIVHQDKIETKKRGIVNVQKYYADKVLKAFSKLLI
jgi:nicotinamide-nucleotide amidase